MPDRGNTIGHQSQTGRPCRGIHHYERYISLGVSAYNLKKIGRRILETQRQQLKEEYARMLKAA